MVKKMSDEVMKISIGERTYMGTQTADKEFLVWPDVNASEYLQHENDGTLLDLKLSPNKGFTLCPLSAEEKLVLDGLRSKMALVKSTLIARLENEYFRKAL